MKSSPKSDSSMTLPWGFHLLLPDASTTNKIELLSIYIDIKKLTPAQKSFELLFSKCGEVKFGRIKSNCPLPLPNPLNKVFHGRALLISSTQEAIDPEATKNKP